MPTGPRRRPPFAAILAVFVWIAAPARPAAAMDRLCDPSFQNCRTELLSLIDHETQEIDAAFWFMEDYRYVAHIVNRFHAGVKVRLLVDPRASASSTYNQTILDAFAAAGVPMRKRVAPSILHWKTMIFGGQGVVEFSAANYSANAFDPVSPYTNYVDEAIYFTDHSDIVESFMTKFDSSWVNTTSFRNYANVPQTLVRSYPTFSIDTALNFPPGQSYTNRALDLYAKEPHRIDVIMYRITQQKHSDAMIAAVRRGVIVRLITEPKEYRNPKKLWDAWNVDRMWVGGVQIRIRAHAGLTHQKSVILRDLGTVIFGSSNWTSSSDDYQQEHNYFAAAGPVFVSWFVNQFLRKWNNSTGAIETKPFTPLPPDKPKYRTPANAAYNVSRSLSLKWYAGPWAHYYDVYFGTSSTPPKIASNVHLGPSRSSSDSKSYQLPTLAAHRTYYWTIVSKTAAGKTANGPVWSFSTGS